MYLCIHQTFPVLLHANFIDFIIPFRHLFKKLESSAGTYHIPLKRAIAITKEISSFAKKVRLGENLCYMIESLETSP